MNGSHDLAVTGTGTAAWLGAIASPRGGSRL